MNQVLVTVEDIERTALSALISHGATRANAAPVARAIARAEADGNRVCGLFYLPIFCAHLHCGKVDGRAEPEASTRDAVVAVDAKFGFAHPAIETGLPLLFDAATKFGIASMAVRNSYNCLALAHHVAPLAERNLIGICMSNAPASAAPPGATKRLLGTNPIAFAIPMPTGRPIIVDQSMTAVTKTEMILRRQRGEAIPLGWAQDGDGRPTTDPAIGLEGSLLPAGGQKGANIALLIEILAAALTGSNLSSQASMFGDNEGGPPGVGQFVLAISPGHFSGDALATNLCLLAKTVAEAGIRLPGRSEAEETQVTVDSNLWQSISVLAG